MIAIKAGELDELIEIQYKGTATTVETVYGTEETPSWTPLVVLPGSPTVAAPVWAQFQDVLPSRDERNMQGVSVSTSRSRVRFRYRSDVDGSMRIIRKSTGAVYQIVGPPAMIGRRQWTEVLVEKFSS